MLHTVGKLCFRAKFSYQLNKNRTTIRRSTRSFCMSFCLAFTVSVSWQDYRTRLRYGNPAGSGKFFWGVLAVVCYCWRPLASVCVVKVQCYGPCRCMRPHWRLCPCFEHSAFSYVSGAFPALHRTGCISALACPIYN